MYKKHLDTLAYHYYHSREGERVSLSNNYKHILAKQSLSLFFRDDLFRMFSLGTGFSISPHFLLTNEHVIRDQPAYVSRFNELSVLCAEEGFDVALCYSKKRLFYTQFYFAKDIIQDESVYLLGKTKKFSSQGKITHQSIHPYALESNKTNFLNYFNLSQENKIRGFQAVGSYLGVPGSSGSPLVNERGDFLGLHRAIVNTNKLPEQDLKELRDGRGVFLRYEYIQEFIENFLRTQGITL